jgi:ABC-2 type transport system permease protein
MNFLLAVGTLWQREIVRFVRQRNRVASALGTPLVFWVLLGSGLAGSFRAATPLGGSRYLEYSFPGTLALIVLFTAIFATISVIEDRQVGFLQSVLVAPVPRSAITLGKILGSTTLALGQALLFVLLAPAIGIPLGIGKLAALAAVLLAVAFGLSALGFLIAWEMDSTQGFHAVMNLLLMPMWLLSGAFFPAEGAPTWLRLIIAANPLTYGVAALRRVLYLEAGRVEGIPPLGASLAITLGFAALMFAATSARAARPGR